MANASVLQAVNRATVAQALQQARQQSAEHQAWLNAINRASLFLVAEQWQFDGETLIIASATTNGARYVVTPQTCQCKAYVAAAPAGIALPLGCSARPPKSCRPLRRPGPSPKPRPPSMSCSRRDGGTMTHTELLALAKEIAASEGIPLAAAIEIARQEQSSLQDYAEDHP
jgi:hypothetical protein